MGSTNMAQRPPALRAGLWMGLLALAMLTGCSHYHLGTDTPLAFQTLYVAPVQMRALVPEAQPLLSAALRTAFAQDGRVSLANSPDDADATLTLTVTGYRREVAVARANDTGLARKFVVNLTATASLRNNRTAHDLFTDRPLSASRDVFTDSGQLQAEYQILPLLAQDLAQKAAHAALDTW